VKKKLEQLQLGSAPVDQRRWARQVFCVNDHAFTTHPW